MTALTQTPVLLALIGILLLIVEFAVFGFSSLFLVFISSACFTTAILQKIGLLPQDLFVSSISVALFSALFGFLLWKPLRKMQDQQQPEQNQPNSINGLQFRLAGDIGPLSPGKHLYSGIEWVVELDEGLATTLPAGTSVVVSRSTVGKLFVRPADSEEAA